jgi:hypothetical protein
MAAGDDVTGGPVRGPASRNELVHIPGSPGDELRRVEHGLAAVVDEYAESTAVVDLRDAPGVASVWADEDGHLAADPWPPTNESIEHPVSPCSCWRRSSPFVSRLPFPAMIGGDP